MILLITCMILLLYDENEFDFISENNLFPFCITPTVMLISEGQPSCCFRYLYLSCLLARSVLHESNLSQATGTYLTRLVNVYVVVNLRRNTGCYLNAVLRRHSLFCIIFPQSNFFEDDPISWMTLSFPYTRIFVSSNFSCS